MMNSSSFVSYARHEVPLEQRVQIFLNELKEAADNSREVMSLFTNVHESEDKKNLKLKLYVLLLVDSKEAEEASSRKMYLYGGVTGQLFKTHFY